MKIRKVYVGFSVGDDETKSFTIYHNLPDTAGLSLLDAVNSWLARTNKFTAKSLCDYIKSKHTNYVAMTPKQFDRLFPNQQKEQQ